MMWRKGIFYPLIEMSVRLNYGKEWSFFKKSLEVEFKYICAILILGMYFERKYQILKNDISLTPVHCRAIHTSHESLGVCQGYQI